jgi:hypothetical protein
MPPDPSSTQYSTPDLISRLKKHGPRACSHLGDVLERERNYQDRGDPVHLSCKTLDSDSFETTSLWMDRTQWKSIYTNVRRDVLLAATRLPDRYSFTNSHQIGCCPTAHDLDVVDCTSAERDKVLREPDTVGFSMASSFKSFVTQLQSSTPNST